MFRELHFPVSDVLTPIHSAAFASHKKYLYQSILQNIHLIPFLFIFGT